MEPINEITKLASDLIAIPSISSDISQLNKVVDFIDQYCLAAGLKAEKLSYSGKPSLLIKLNSGPVKVLLNGHADVVPAKPHQFQPQVQAGKLYGRGAEDMKGQLAVLIYSIAQLAKTNSSLPIQLLVNTDEEIGGHNGAKIYADTLKSHPDFVLVGEGTGFKIENAAKGVNWLKLITSGIRAHGAYPWKGENAINKLLSELNVVNSFYPKPADFVWETTCNIGQIGGGEAANQIPDLAWAILDIRRIPQDSSVDLLKQLNSAKIFPDTKYEILTDEPAHYADPSNPYIEKISQSLSQTLNISSEFMQQCGASDARHFSALGIPAVCFGPQGSGLHSDEEYIEIAQLDQYYQVLKNFLARVS